MKEVDTGSQSNFLGEMRKRGYAVERAEGINFGLLHINEADGATVVDEIDKQSPDVLVLECAGHTRRLARQIENFIFRDIPVDDKRYMEAFKNPFLKGVVLKLKERAQQGKRVPVVVLSDLRAGSQRNTFVPIHNAYIRAPLDALQKKLSFEEAKKHLMERTSTYVSADQARERMIVHGVPNAIQMGRRSDHLRSLKSMKVMFAYGADHSSLTSLASDFGIPTKQTWQHPEMPRDYLSQLSGRMRLQKPVDDTSAEKALIWPIVEKLSSQVPAFAQLQFNSVDHVKRFLQVVIDSFSPQDRRDIYEGALAGTGVGALLKAMAGKNYNAFPPLRRGQRPRFEITVHTPPPGTIINLTPPKDDSSKDE